MAARKLRPVRIEGNLGFLTLTRGYEAIIDAGDAEFAGRFNWCCLVTPHSVYAQRTVKRGGKKIALLLHRELITAATGAVVDHISGNGLDNRRSNLRLATRAQNSCNQRRR